MKFLQNIGHSLLLPSSLTVKIELLPAIVMRTQDHCTRMPYGWVLARHEVMKSKVTSKIMDSINKHLSADFCTKEMEVKSHRQTDAACQFYHYDLFYSCLNLLRLELCFDFFSSGF